MLKTGKGEFYITGLMTKNKDGEDLTMKNGGKYKKLKLMVTDRAGNSETLYDPIFGADPEKVEQVVNSLGYPSLARALKAGKLELKELIGSGGECIIGVKEREGYDAQNTIECYLKNRGQEVAPMLSSSVNHAAESSFEPEDEKVPF